MTVRNTQIPGLVVIDLRVFSDSRGQFHESYNKTRFDELVSPTDFVQDNISVSAKGVLRGLHFQNPPCAQAKLVSVLKGAVLDIAVDLRKSSSTYGQHHKEVISAENAKQMLIPRGFAHGFLALESDTIFSYKCDGNYSSQHEGSLLWNDPDLKIDWGIRSPLLSEKDLEAQSFAAFDSPFD